MVEPGIAGRSDENIGQSIGLVLERRNSFSVIPATITCVRDGHTEVHTSHEEAAMTMWAIAPMFLAAQVTAAAPATCPVTTPVKADAPRDPNASPMTGGFWHIRPIGSCGRRQLRQAALPPSSAAIRYARQAPRLCSLRAASTSPARPLSQPSEMNIRRVFISARSNSRLMAAGESRHAQGRAPSRSSRIFGIRFGTRFAG